MTTAPATPTVSSTSTTSRRCWADRTLTQRCARRPRWSMSEVAVDRLLAKARQQLDRVEPDELEREMRGGALVVDIRPAENRRREGSLPGAVVIERIHLEWRLD